MTRLLYISFSCLILFSFTFVQLPGASFQSQKRTTIDSIDYNNPYFPHKLGNIWEYYWNDGGIGLYTLQRKVIYDSVDVAGNQYSIIDNYFINPYSFKGMEYYKVDTSGNVLMSHEDFDAENQTLIWNANANVGDFWALGPDSMYWSQYNYRIDTVFWGNNTVLSSISVVLWENYPDSSYQLYLGWSNYALNTGFVSEGGTELAPVQTIKGALIDNIIYGDIYTAISEYDNIDRNNCFLAANYPNPFNQTTTIRFQLSNPETVTISIYNAAGKRIRVLADKLLFNTGIHEQLWDGKDNNGAFVSSGIYFYRFSGNSFTDTKSMILIK